MNKLRITTLMGLSLVVSFSLSGCIIVTNGTVPEVGIPSLSPTEESAVRLPASGLTQPIVPIEESQLVDCPNMNAINLYDSPYLDNEIVGANICKDGVTYKVMPTNSWASAYRANNIDPSIAKACVKMAMDPKIVWVDYGDEIVAVYAPQDSCGFPQDTASKAYDELILESNTSTYLEGEPTATALPG